MKKIGLAILIIIGSSAFTDLSSDVKLTGAGLQEEIEWQGQKALKFSEGVTFKIKEKELSSHVAIYLKNKTLLAEEFVVLKIAPGQEIMADKFTYDERKQIGHFSAQVRVKNGGTATYQTVDYNFKTGKILNSQP